MPPTAWRAIAAPHLSSGEAIPGGVRNMTLCSIAGRLRFEGHDIQVIEAVLLAVNSTRCVPPMADRSIKSIARWIARKPAGPGAGAVPRPQYDAAREAVCQLATGCEAYPWRGRASATDRDVVWAFIKVAYDCGRLTFAASERQIAERAGVGRRTLLRALRRAAVRHWVRRVRRGRFDGSTTWQLRAPRSMGQTVTIKAVNTAFRRMVSECHTEDVWRWGGLGKRAFPVFECLATAKKNGASARQIALACELPPRTVGRVLERLARYGLAVEGPDGWARGPATPEEIAPRLKSYGAGDRQRQRHAHDREQHRDDLARRAQCRGRLMLVARELRD